MFLNCRELESLGPEQVNQDTFASEPKEMHSSLFEN